MRKISLIVIHCSATRVDRDFTARDVDTAHRFRGFSCWGYPYYIRKSGQIEPMRDEDTVGAHARGFNAISLGAVSYTHLNAPFRNVPVCGYVSTPVLLTVSGK